MNKFCVGQKVINVFTRKYHLVTALRGNGVIVLDGKIEDVESEYQIEDHFLDKTNYFYHHSRFGDGQQMARDGFCEYRGSVEELEYLKSLVTGENPSAFMLRAISMCEGLIETAAAKIERGLAVKRTAEHNLAQWDQLTLDHHFPFLNPENVTDY